MTRHAAAFLFVALVSARADTLTFRNGTVVTGSWVGIDAKQINFLVNDEIRTYPRSDISKVTFGPEPADPQAAHQPRVELGMTRDQVTAILGKPEEMADQAGAKQVYTYEKLKVTFTDGKVTDVR
jgi:hypothetical protein